MHTPARILLLLLWCPAVVGAQTFPSKPAGELDWRSALIIRFDAAGTGIGEASTGGGEARAGSGEASTGSGEARARSGEARAGSGEARADAYLSHVTAAIESGWVTMAGAKGVAVGPLSLPENRSSSDEPRIAAASASGSVGSAAEWKALLSAAENAEITLILVIGTVTASVSAGELTSLAEWMIRHRLRHVILEGTPGAAEGAASAIRAAWGRSDGARDGVWIGGPSEAAPSTVSSYDAVISPPVTDLPADHPAFSKLYGATIDRAASSTLPLITALPSTFDSASHDARFLLLPGSLLVTTSLPVSDARPLWLRVAAFRQRHPAVSIGEHEELANTAYSFTRTYTDRGMSDAVIVAFGAAGKTTLNVSRIFPDNALLRDSITGNMAFVSFGMATFDADPSGILLIEEAL